LLLLSKYNSQTEYEEGILEKAEEEISRICANLKLESYNGVKKVILLKFKKVWIQLSPITHLYTQDCTNRLHPEIFNKGILFF